MTTTTTCEWVQASAADVGRLARFSSCVGGQWTYGLLSDLHSQECTFGCIQWEGDTTGYFLMCEVQSPPTVQPSNQPAPPEPVPFNPPYVPVSPSGFQIPTGTYRGRRLNELDNDTLRNLYNGFKGCRRNDIAETILAEIHLRQGNL